MRVATPRISGIADRPRRMNVSQHFGGLLPSRLPPHRSSGVLPFVPGDPPIGDGHPLAADVHLHALEAIIDAFEALGKEEVGVWVQLDDSFLEPPPSTGRRPPARE